MKYPVLTAMLGLACAQPVLAQHGDHSHEPSATPADDGPPPPAEHQAPHGDSTDPIEHRHDDGTGPVLSGAHQSMTGALGPWPVSREASGTAWQPDASRHGGIHIVSSGWMVMGHAMLNLVHDWQEGPRGGDKTFVSGMVMAMARRDLADGERLQLRAMLSPEPLMGKRGYPLHLAAGETADGETLLVDRQHPHDLFMELAASYCVRIGEVSSVFLYGGLPANPPSVRRRSCTGCRSWTARRRRSATIGSIPRISVSAC